LTQATYDTRRNELDELLQREDGSEKREKKIKTSLCKFFKLVAADITLIGLLVGE
jgi:hypothetical protein